MPICHFTMAYAKINLTLDVLGKRPDGYHDLASIMQSVALADTIRLCESSTRATSCFCDVDELNSADNLAARAAERLREYLEHHRPGIRVEISKGIPFQAGMGGGSSDAAATLVALNSLWRLKLPESELQEIGAQLGSDVPFFIRGGTQFIEGRGEQVTPLPELSPLWVLIATPPVRVSTPRIFDHLSASEWTDGQHSREVAQAVRENNPLPRGKCTNALESVAFRLFPAIRDLRDALVHAGAGPVHMSGSGPTLFALFDSLDSASHVLRKAQDAKLPVQLTRTVSAREIASLRDTYGGLA